MRIFIVFLIILTSRTGLSQSLPYNLKAHTEFGGSIATGKTIPFWLRTNQNGIVPNVAPFGTIRLGLHRAYLQHDTLPSGKGRKWNWGFGLNTIGNLGKQKNQFLVAEGYFKVKFHKVEILAGRRNTVTGLGDSTLSSGFMVVSGNALAVPKILISTPDYLPIKILKKYLAINFGFAHGWYNSDYIKKAFIHQKYFYLRLGKPQSKFKIYTGLHHQVLWGGEAEYLKLRPDLAKNGKLPSSLKYFGNILLGTIPKRDNNLSVFDGDYRIGDHVGSYDAAMEISSSKGLFLLYHQHIFDDVSGAVLKNFPDGLSGFSWHKKVEKDANNRFHVQRVVMEFISTLSQSGRSFVQLNSGFQGNDNYFNHAQYNEGWSYFGKTIGTPFIIPWKDVTPKASESRGDYFPNNRIQVFYAGSEVVLNQNLKLISRLSLSNNFGTNDHPYPQTLHQFSYIVSTEIKMRKFYNSHVAISISGDKGQLLPNANAIFCSIRKEY
ncbi:capsule assembly Wzi family protein [Dyadobacter sp. LHD-138]|uniref:capsule assembly Wzi family protein n=1 Tax=Dyadobacter sp. LHD-138 TaxID=3071413 RepID=UPI0027DEBEFE|nr:capsule assembly Wzi family protein [Dyadobacter sp. LHD-138]MDQ6480142.1 capsule assembly Wzi family protein [Dyadobacter sp. LHD-138]